MYWVEGELNISLKANAQNDTSKESSEELSIKRLLENEYMVAMGVLKGFHTQTRQTVKPLFRNISLEVRRMNDFS